MCNMIVVILLKKSFEEINLGFRGCVVASWKRRNHPLLHISLSSTSLTMAKRSKRVEGQSHVQYIIISNCSAVVGIFAVVVSWVWVFIRRRVGFWQVDWLKIVKKDSVQLINLVPYKFYNDFHNERVLLEGLCFAMKGARLFWNCTDNNVKNTVSYFVVFLLQSILLRIIHIYVIRDYGVEERQRGVWRWGSGGESCRGWNKVKINWNNLTLRN
jgi:hypothetical protein